MRIFVRKIIFVMVLALMMSFAFIGCEEEKFTVTYNASEGGYIQGEQTQEVEKGSDASEVTAVARNGYKFKVWSDGVETAERQDINITANKEVTAEFEPVEKYTVTYNASEGGYIQGEQTQEVEKGSDASVVTAVARNGYKFKVWSDGVETAERQDTNITANKEVTAEFEPVEKFTVTYNASEGGYIHGEQTQEVEKGSDASEVTAVASEGYKFKVWSDGVETAERQDTNITANKEVTAEFEFCFESGNGTAEAPYMIAEYDHLVNMGLNPNANYKLKSDLDLNGIEFEPLFTEEDSFMGKFDGDNKSIINLAINSKSEYPSLFGYIGKGAEVGNLALKNIQITIKDFDDSYEMYAVGALAGVSMGDVHDIKAEVTMTGGNMGNYNMVVGGLIGYSRLGISHNCEVNVAIDINDAEIKDDFSLNLGGFIGKSCSSVVACTVEGYIKTEISNKPYMTSINIGGFIGGFDDLGSAQKIEIKKCLADVQIESSGSANYGGFIGEIIMHNDEHEVLLDISECTTQGNLSIKGSWAGGFICNVRDSENSEIRLNNCFSKGDVTGTGNSGGFIQLARIHCDKRTFEITNCHVSGNVFGYFAAGFCVKLWSQRTGEKSNTVISGCSVVGTVAATSSASGFILLTSDLDMEKCYSLGDVSAPYHGSGFIYMVRCGKIVNCYSTSNITLTNTDSQAGRTLVGGFIYSLSDSEMSNCYYAGEVRGKVYSHSSATGEPIVGAFIGRIDEDTTITNSHSLHNEKTFAPDLIGENLSSGQIEITSYNNIEEMYFLADVLNGEFENIWENVPNSTPKFK